MLYAVSQMEHLNRSKLVGIIVSHSLQTKDISLAYFAKVVMQVSSPLMLVTIFPMLL